MKYFMEVLISNLKLTLGILSTLVYFLVVFIGYTVANNGKSESKQIKGIWTILAASVAYLVVTAIIVWNY